MWCLGNTGASQSSHTQGETEMGEELNPSAGEVTTPASETAVPVVPAAEPTPSIPVVESLNPDPAAAEQAPTEPAASVDPFAPISAATGLPAEPLKRKIETPAAEAAPETPAPEQPAAEEVVEPINNEIVELAIGVIKSTRKSSVAHFQRKMGFSAKRAELLVEELTNRGILGPANGVYPRKILIECDPAPKAPEKKPANNAKPARKIITDYDRMQDWKKHLQNFGKYTDEGLINDLCQFAQKNSGFSATRKWGSCLIVMINRLSSKLRDTLRQFGARDAEYIVHELLRFLSEQPLGDGPQTWNTRYTTNKEQKDVVSKFFGIDKPFREMRGKQESVMTAVRDAAWPNQKEESQGTGGTYAERFHYMIMAVVAMSNGGHQEALFGVAYHSEPTEEFLNKFGGGAPRQQQRASWHTDGMCECGCPVTTDSNGNTICSSPICVHHFAAVSGEVAESFRNGDHRDTSAVDAPVPQNDGGRRNKKNWKHNKRDDEGRDEFRKPRGKKQRYASRDIDDEGDAPAPQSSGEGDGRLVASVGGEFHNNPFGDLKIPEN